MEQLIKKEKLRLDYLDFAKGIAIFLVIWGHTTGNLDTPPYRVLLYSFHMPLFFLVSGVVISRHRHEYDKKHWTNFLVKNTMTLLVPYFIWGAIYSNFTYENFGKLFYGSWQIINEAETLSSIWFLLCLFAARAMAEFVLMISWKFKMIERHLFSLIIAVLSFAIGLLLPKISIGYPLCFDVAFVALGFILLGYATKDLLLKLTEKSILVHILLTVAFAGFLLLGQITQHNKDFVMLMCKSEYGNILPFFLSSIGGTGMVLSVSMLLSKFFANRDKNILKKYMVWVGMNTIGIFLLHKPFLWQVVMPCLEKFGAKLPNPWWALLGSVIALAFSSVTAWIINRYVPSLFGRFPKKIKQ